MALHGPDAAKVLARRHAQERAALARAVQFAKDRRELVHKVADDMLVTLGALWPAGTEHLCRSSYGGETTCTACTGALERGEEYATVCRNCYGLLAVPAVPVPDGPPAAAHAATAAAIDDELVKLTNDRLEELEKGEKELAGEIEKLDGELTTVSQNLTSAISARDKDRERVDARVNDRLHAMETRIESVISERIAKLERLTGGHEPLTVGDMCKRIGSLEAWKGEVKGYGLLQERLDGFGLSLAELREGLTNVATGKFPGASSAIEAAVSKLMAALESEVPELKEAIKAVPELVDRVKALEARTGAGDE